jgi:hypothetical protein
MEAYSDHGTVLDENECAIVSTDNMTQVNVLMPNFEDDAKVPPLVIYLFACAVRYDKDPEFVQEMIEWFLNEGNTKFSS